MDTTRNQTAPTFYDLDLQSQNNFTNDTLSNSPYSTLLDQTINWICILILFDTMVSLGCTMEISKIKAHIVKPKGVVIAMLAQFGVMPLTAFSMVKLFKFSPGAAMAVMVCGCCPGGMFSNILAFALNGDMNLSIVMTTCSTLAALGMIPLLLFIYCHGFSNVHAVPYVGIFLALILTVLPCAIGIYINYRVPEKSKLVVKVGLGIMVVGYIVLGILLSLFLGPVIWAVTERRLVATGALMPLIGYVLGYVLSLFFSFDEPCRRTVAVETGCQNLHLCFTILEVAFEREVIGPYTLFPFVYFLFQILEALVFIIIFRCYKKSSKNSEMVRRSRNII
ncbi:hepatic sodium/bile acid cotransporter-like [Clarias gariepinus]|uniref:hepatic sodium/bile acid cotransporter-like n=1 Tax=Clarias gariepinus TaxID=13013 RepID=UPI00234D5F62|nr:hepatic sodium/bile acid cotransporter-like [Clarias gariepinus]XP_053344916.1 hepatic sodium/bile acid cotransporter-like [Clarias gariepinus]XP_053344917.1 hepatic sodium/bile acid cotransporter-like [Clarias gariepinus]